MSDDKLDPKDSKVEQPDKTDKGSKNAADSIPHIGKKRTEEPSAEADIELENAVSPNDQRAAASPEDSKPTQHEAEKPALFTAPPAPRMPVRRKHRSRRIIPWLISLLLLIVLAGVAWVNYTQYQMQQTWQQLETDVGKQLSMQTEVNQTGLQTARSGLAAAQDNQTLINQQSQLVIQLRDALSATQEKLRELSGRRQQDWLLAEAEYLIKLAEYKITLEKDRQTAIALLKTADEKIVQIGDNQLFDLRQGIAQDITDLQLIIAPDVSGVAVQLNSIASQISSLSITALEFEPIAARAEQPQETPTEFSWDSFYHNFLDDFVTIKDHSQPVKPLMTLEQRGNLNANIQLALQQAQIALVRGEQGLYDVNINNAIDWIKQFFKIDETSEVLLESLLNLQQQRVNTDLPNALRARQRIQAINQQRLYQWLEQPNKIAPSASESSLETEQ